MSLPTQDDDLAEIMSRAAGRRFLRRLMALAGDSDGFSSDPLMLAYQSGVRFVARDLEARTRQACPELWMMMHREAIAADEDEDREAPRAES